MKTASASSNKKRSGGSIKQTSTFERFSFIATTPCLAKMLRNTLLTGLFLLALQTVHTIADTAATKETSPVFARLNTWRAFGANTL